MNCGVESRECGVWNVWSVECAVSQSATSATQNDMSTSCDTSKKTRLCDFSHRHGNFHTWQRQNQGFPTSFLMDRLQNRRFVRGFRRFS